MSFFKTLIEKSFYIIFAKFVSISSRIFESYKNLKKKKSFFRKKVKFRNISGKIRNNASKQSEKKYFSSKKIFNFLICYSIAKFGCEEPIFGDLAISFNNWNQRLFQGFLRENFGSLVSNFMQFFKKLFGR